MYRGLRRLLHCSRGALEVLVRISWKPFYHFVQEFLYHDSLFYYMLPEAVLSHLNSPPPKSTLVTCGSSLHARTEGRDVNDYSDALVAPFCQRGHAAIVQALIHHKADIDGQVSEEAVVSHFRGPATECRASVTFNATVALLERLEGDIQESDAVTYVHSRLILPHVFHAAFVFADRTR